MTATELNKRILSCRVALFTGAGASVPLDLPDTKSFVTAFDRRLREKGSGLHSWLTQAMDAAGTSDVEALLDNIDGWLETLAAARIVPAGQHQNELESGMQSTIHFYEELRTELRRAVVEIYGRIKPKRAAQLYRPLLLEFWAEQGLGRTLPVFTTNYDGAIETVADQAGREIDFVDGFRHRPMGLRWESSEYHNYRTRRRKGVDLVLFKLHGSSNWYKMPGGSIQKMDNFELDPGNLKSIMIFPTQRKSGLVGDEPFDTSYRYFTALLERVRVLIAIGFSFRDTEIRDLIWAALRDRADFHLIVVDPGFTHDGLLKRLSDGEDRAAMQGQLDVIQQAFGSEDAWTTTASMLGTALAAFRRSK